MQRFKTIVIILIFSNLNGYSQSSVYQSLAKNITRLLDKLLTNYTKSLRPTHELGKLN